MTFALEAMIQSAQREVTAFGCHEHGHDWISEGGRSCPMGADGCSQTVFVCRSCGVHDYGDGSDSPAKIECQSVCGDSMMGWRNGPLDPEPDYGIAD